MKKQKETAIQGCSRKEAIAEGLLIDVSTAAREAGIRHPTALTRQAWERYVTVPRGAIGETEERRLRNILQALRLAAEQSKPRETSLFFTVWVHDGEEMQFCGLRAVCGPGDDLEPVIIVRDGVET
jgi:hypothetical protein